jgi:hypothetical protein
LSVLEATEDGVFVEDHLLGRITLVYKGVVREAELTGLQPLEAGRDPGVGLEVEEREKSVVLGTASKEERSDDGRGCVNG